VPVASILDMLIEPASIELVTLPAPIVNTPVLLNVTSPDEATEVATLDPLPTRKFPLVRVVVCFPFNADCKSVWSESVPVIEPHIPAPPTGGKLTPPIVTGISITILSNLIRSSDN